MARELPGLPDSWSIVTPTCRKRPNEDVIQDVLDNVEESLGALLDAWEDDDEANIHIVVSLDRDGQKKP